MCRILADSSIASVIVTTCHETSFEYGLSENMEKVEEYMYGNNSTKIHFHIAK